MPVVKINAIEVPPDAGPELEKRFAHRAHAVDNQPGFLGFQLLRPVKGEDRYFVVTQWESEEAFQAWATGPAVEAHAGQRANPVATGASLLEFEVVLDVAGTGADGVARAGHDTSGRAHGCGRARRRPGLRLRQHRTDACGRRRVRRSHRHQHPPGSAGQADHGHAQFRLAHRHRRGAHAGRSGRWSTTSAPRWTRSVVGPAVHGHRHRHRRRAGDSARADVLQRRAGHRTAHQRRRTGRPLRRSRCSRRRSRNGPTSTPS